MKKLLRSVAVLLAAAAVACFCSMSAFAEAADDTMTDAELQELLEMLESQGTVASGTDVSGTDISGSDVIGTTARSFGDYEMVEQNIKEYIRYGGGEKYIRHLISIFPPAELQAKTE